MNFFSHSVTIEVSRAFCVRQIVVKYETSQIWKIWCLVVYTSSIYWRVLLDVKWSDCLVSAISKHRISVGACECCTPHIRGVLDTTSEGYEATTVKCNAWLCNEYWSIHCSDRCDVLESKYQKEPIQRVVAVVQVVQVPKIPQWGIRPRIYNWLN